LKQRREGERAPVAAPAGLQDWAGLRGREVNMPKEREKESFPFLFFVLFFYFKAISKPFSKVV
jgi:hypothetical protein